MASRGRQARRPESAAGLPPQISQRIASLSRRMCRLRSDLEKLADGGIDAFIDPTSHVAFLLQGAQDAIQRSEAFFRDLIGQAPVAVLKLSPEGLILFANRKAEEIAGVHASLTGRLWQEIFTTASAGSSPWRQLHKLIGESLDFDVALATGECRTVSWRLVAKPASVEGPPVLFAYGLDVSERKRGERDLRETQNHLLLAQRIGRTGSLDIDLASLTFHCSDETWRLFGMEPRPMPARLDTLVPLIYSEDQPHILASRDAWKTVGKLAPVEFRVARPNGDIRWMVREGEILAGGAGASERAVLTIHDITEVRAQATKLRHSETHLRHAQRVAAIGSFEIDFSSGQIQWSDEAYRMFGITPGTPIAQGVFDQQVVPEDRAQVKEYLEAARQGRQPPPMEFHIKCADGNTRTIYSECELLFDDEGKSTGVVGVDRDVTEIREYEMKRSELESRLVHSQRLEAIGALASGVSHEFRNLLVPVVGLSKLLLDKTPPESRDHRSLELIGIAGKRARDLVQKLLAFSRDDPPEMRMFDLGDVVQEALSMLRATLPSTMRLVDHVEAVPPVWGDPGQLNQVLINFMTNAAGAIGDAHGTITVEVGASLDVDEDGTERSSTRLSVTDTGCGMDDVTKSRMFEPFYTTKKIGEGTGLGLSVIHGIVAAHGGRIEVQSKLGQGTRFDVFLPCNEAKRIDAAAPREIAFH